MIELISFFIYFYFQIKHCKSLLLLISKSIFFHLFFCFGLFWFVWGFFVCFFFVLFCFVLFCFCFVCSVLFFFVLFGLVFIAIRSDYYSMTVRKGAD